MSSADLLRTVVSYLDSVVQMTAVQKEAPQRRLSAFVTVNDDRSLSLSPSLFPTLPLSLPLLFSPPLLPLSLLSLSLSLFSLLSLLSLSSFSIFTLFFSRQLIKFFSSLIGIVQSSIAELNDLFIEMQSTESEEAIFCLSRVILSIDQVNIFYLISF